MKITLIGPLQLNTPPIGGEVAKNQNLYDFLNKKYIIHTVCTYNWKNKPFLLLRVVKAIFFNKKSKILIISCCTPSAYKLIKICYLFRVKKDIHYFVIGNTISSGIKKNIYNLKYFKIIKQIYVEGKATKNEMNSYLMNNVSYLPNFKNFDKKHLDLPVLKNTINNAVSFVFVSRINKTKGVDIIFNSVLELLNKNLKFNVTFFGPIEKKYLLEFQNKIKLYDNVNYGGYINFKEEASYEALSAFDVMLFPSIWEGEGFPGVFIDAFISGLPIIASDWNLNSELIVDFKNGILVKPNSSVELTNAMSYLINN